MEQRTFSQQQEKLLNEVKLLLPNLTNIDLFNLTVQYAQPIVELLVKVSESSFPWNLTLDFDREHNLRMVALWSDVPREDRTSREKSIKKRYAGFPEVRHIENNPNSLINALQKVYNVTKPDKKNGLKRICIAGESLLVNIGTANEPFFVHRNPVTVFGFPVPTRPK